VCVCVCVCVCVFVDTRHSHNKDVIKQGLARVLADSRQPHPTQTHTHTHQINTIAVPNMLSIFNFSMLE